MIDLCNIDKRFNAGTEKAVHAVRHVCARFETGCSYAIMGASGAGKSTLLSIIGLLLMPSAGAYFLDGRRVDSLSSDARCRIRAKSMGFVVQDFALIEEATALENVCAPLLLNGLGMRKAKIRSTEALERIEMGDFINKPVRHLSGGQRQRVALARSWVHVPQILLCDEPTGALDSKTAEQVLDVLFQNRPPQSVVIIVTHNAQVAKRCNQIIHMADGQIVVWKE